MADALGGRVQVEDELRSRLVRGEAAALGELYDRYAPVVHALAVELLTDEKDARTLVTDVFSHAWQHPGSFDPARQPLAAWLLGETRERAAAMPGAAPAEDPRDPRTPDAAGPGTAGAPPGPGTAACPMPIALRAVLHLVCVRNLDYRQAAAELGITQDEACRRLDLVLRFVAAGRGAHGEETR
jgi:RNA polymerase sigma-70 factor, ECF subfamily